MGKCPKRPSPSPPAVVGTFPNNLTAVSRALVVRHFAALFANAKNRLPAMRPPCWSGILTNESPGSPVP
jgi:hypothetical protein